MKLHLKNVSKHYGEVTALNDLNIEIDDCHCLALIGPSGGGKSTTLRLLAGLEPPTSGQIAVQGTQIPKEKESLRHYRKSIGIVFQAYNLFPHFDALTNISLPLEKVHGFSPDRAKDRALELLERFQLSDHALKRPAELSGGQNQRVAIARALGHEPDLLMLDEPTSALDPEMTAEVLEIIEQLLEEKKDVIIVTHQMGFARRVADQITLIAEGRNAESGSPAEIFEAPQSAFTQKFLSRVLKY